MIEFTKMHGAGNDYIYVDVIRNIINDPERAAIEWSKPHFGIGSDGLVLIGKATTPTADFSMRIFNNDGSEAMMCGNGARCVARYLHDKHLTDKNPILLETLSGVKTLWLNFDGRGEVESVTVDMGEPRLSNKEQFIGSLKPLSHSKSQASETENLSYRKNLVAGDKTFAGTFVSMGNPHFVCFVNNVELLDIKTYGSLLERNKAFPQRCNIEFAQVLKPGLIRTRVWERGSGVTLACGTGACATAVAACIARLSGRQSRIIMDGGELQTDWRDDNHIYLTGPAEITFEGRILWH